MGLILFIENGRAVRVRTDGKCLSRYRDEALSSRLGLGAARLEGDAGLMTPVRRVVCATVRQAGEPGSGRRLGSDPPDPTAGLGMPAGATIRFDTESGRLRRYRASCQRAVISRRAASPFASEAPSEPNDRTDRRTITSSRVIAQSNRPGSFGDGLTCSL